jgi:TRAP-type C4-dicarboxylate transport system substrate-binding protein
MKLKTALAGAAIGVALIATPAAATIEWDLASVFAPTSADGIAAQHFADLVREKTGGEIDITIHFSGALGYKCPDLLGVVETGALPLASICTTQLGGHNPFFLASTLPFMINTAEDARLYRDSYIDLVEEAYGAHNQVVLYSYPNTPAGLWAKEDKPTPEALKNWKLRTFDANSLSTMRNAGTAAVNLPWTDVVPALSTGAIDGVFTASDAGFASNFNDYLSHFIAVNGAIGIAEATINADVLAGLSPELREAVLEAGRETTDFAFERMVALVGETFDKMRAAGMTVVEEPSDALMTHLREAGQPVVDAWIEKTGDEGRGMLDAYRAKRDAAN